MLTNAKEMHRVHSSKTSVVVFRPQRTAHFKATESKFSPPASPPLTPEDTEISSLGSMTCPNTPKLAITDLVCSPDIAEADSASRDTISWKTETGDAHIGASELQISATSSPFIGFENPDPSMHNPAYYQPDFLSLGSSLRPQSQVDFPSSNEITNSSMSSANSATFSPKTSGAYATKLASELWFTGDVVRSKQKKSSVTRAENYGPQRSTTCNQDAKELGEIPASLSRSYSNTASSSVPPAENSSQSIEPARTHPFYCFTFSINSKNVPYDREAAKAQLEQCRTDQNISDDAYHRALSRDEEDRRLHTYKPNIHTIAALVVEERNMTNSKSIDCPSDPQFPIEPSSDSDTDVIDTSFIPQSVQQHAESQKKGRQAANQRGSQRGKRAKKSRKNTGRLNKERLCVEKVLQSANEEMVDTPETSDMAEVKAADLSLPKGGGEKNSVNESSSKKKGKRRTRRHNASQATQMERQILSAHTSLDEETHEVQVSSHQNTSLPDMSHDTTDETLTNGVTFGGDCHTAAALEDVGQPGLLRKQVLSPVHETEIEEVIDPQAQASSTNGAGTESCQKATPSSALEQALPSLSSDTKSTSISKSVNVEPQAYEQLKNQVQQPVQQSQKPQQRTVVCIKSSPFHEVVSQPLTYDHGVWRQYTPETNPDYYQPTTQNLSYHHPSSNQMPAYCTPAYNYDPHEPIPEPRYFEPFYGQDWGFYHDQLGRPRYDPNAYATPSRTPISWREWKPYAERRVGQPFGTREHRIEEKDKPWYLQPLVYEEEKEEEYQSGEATYEECKLRSYRKYGL